MVAPREGSVVGVDFSAAMLAVARKSAQTMGLENTEFREADAEAIPVASASINVALVNGIFNLNPNRDAIFQELSRAIGRGGVVSAEL